MRFKLKILAFALLFVSTINAQDLTREQKFQKIEDLKGQVKVLETQLFAPDNKDVKQSEKEGSEVFRLMPRERYDGKLIIQGGGAYYSFTTKSHDYQKNAQIELAQNNLSVGFAGADYGFIYDLGALPLTEVSENLTEAKFLFNYKPPINEPDVRIEQRNSNNYEAEGLIYKSRLPDVVGNTYLLRSISFDRSDVLVAFKVYRKDTDGSLIIFWKLLQNFETPQLKSAASIEESRKREVQSATVNFEAAQKAQNILLQKGFDGVIVDYSTTPLTLRGTVPKGKLAMVIGLVQENNGGKPVKNELTEQ